MDKALDPFAARFLTTFALGPVLLAVVLALIAGKGMKDMWGMPMFNLSGLLLVALTADRFTASSLRRLAIGAAALLVIVPLGYAVAVASGWSKKGIGFVWPQAAMSRQFHEIWHAETGRPLRIVAGDIWTGGLVALTAPDRPSIYINAERMRAPWITVERLAREGALVVWQQKGDRPPPAMFTALIGSARAREAAFAWPDSASRPPLRIGYVIIPPTESVAGDGASLHRR